MDWPDDIDVQNQMKIAIEDELFAFKKAHGVRLDLDTIDRLLDRIIDVASGARTVASQASEARVLLVGEGTPDYTLRRTRLRRTSGIIVEPDRRPTVLSSPDADIEIMERMLRR